MLRSRIVFSVVVGLVLATIPSFAQPPGGFGRGFGPFGSGGMPQSGVLLLGMPEVRSELGVQEARGSS